MAKQTDHGERKSGIGYAFSVFFNSIRDLSRDDGPQWAAAIAFYSLLSIFPLLLAAVSIASYFVDAQWAVEQVTKLLGSYLPQGSAQVADVVKGVFDARGSVSIISILLLIWSGSRVFGVLIKAINIAFDVTKKLSFFKQTAIELLMTLTIGVLTLVALASRSIMLFLGSQLAWFPQGKSLLFNIGLQILSGLVLLLVFYLLYRYTPRMKVDRKPAFTGAVVSAIVFLIARPIFLMYVSKFSNLNLVYGSLAIVVIMIIWAWWVALIILFGGELAAQLQRGNPQPASE